MAKIIIEINATEAEFSLFADELGYQAQVHKSPDELVVVKDEPVSIQDRLKPNPQSKADFLLEYFKRITVDELAKVKIANIQKEVDTAKENQKKNMRTAVENAVTIKKAA